MARLRAAGKIVETGRRDLALSVAEAASLLRKTGAALGAAEVAEPHGRAEGWPTGLYLAALSPCEGGSLTDAVASFTGEYQLVSEYTETQVLARIRPAGVCATACRRTRWSTRWPPTTSTRPPGWRRIR